MDVDIIRSEHLEGAKQCIDAATAIESACRADDRGVFRQSESAPAVRAILRIENVGVNPVLDHRGGSRARVSASDVIGQSRAEARNSFGLSHGAPEESQDARYLACLERFEIVVQVDDAFRFELF